MFKVGEGLGNRDKSWVTLVIRDEPYRKVPDIRSFIEVRLTVPV